MESTSAKDVHRMLMKLILGVNFINVLLTHFLCKRSFFSQNVTREIDFRTKNARKWTLEYFCTMYKQQFTCLMYLSHLDKNLIKVVEFLLYYFRPLLKCVSYSKFGLSLKPWSTPVLVLDHNWAQTNHCQLWTFQYSNKMFGNVGLNSD